MLFDPLSAAAHQEQEQEQENWSVPKFRPSQPDSSTPAGELQETQTDTDPDSSPDSLDLFGQQDAGDAEDSPEEIEAAEGIAVKPSGNESSIDETTSTIEVPSSTPTTNTLFDFDFDPLYLLLLLPILVPILIIGLWIFRKRQPWNAKAYRAEVEGYTDSHGFREKVKPDILRSGKSSVVASQPSEIEQTKVVTPEVIHMGHIPDEPIEEPDAGSAADSAVFADFEFADDRSREDSSAVAATDPEMGDLDDLSDESFGDLDFDLDEEEASSEFGTAPVEPGAPADSVVDATTSMPLVPEPQPMVVEDSVASNVADSQTTAAETAELVMELNRLRASHDELLRESSELRNHLVASHEQITQLQNTDKLPELEKELETLSLQLTEARDAVPPETASELTELRNQLQLVEEAKTAANQRIEEMQQENTGLTTEVDELTKQIAEATTADRTHREEMQQQLADVEAELSDLRQTLESAEADRDQVTGELSAIRTERDKADQRIEDLLAENASFATQIDELQKQASTAAAEADSKLQQQLTSLNDALESARSEKDKLQSRLTTVESEHTDLQSRLGTADKELNQLRDQLLTAKQGPSTNEFEGLQSRVRQLEQDLDESKKEQAITLDELEDARDQLAQRTSPSAMSESETEQKLREKTAKLVKVKQKLREKLDVITELHKRLRSAKRKSVDLNVRVTELENQVESQREELARQTVLLERNQLHLDE